jgi:hypothetical protein
MLGTRHYEAGSEPLRAHDFAGSAARTRAFRSAIIEWGLSPDRPIRSADIGRCRACPGRVVMERGPGLLWLVHLVYVRGHPVCLKDGFLRLVGAEVKGE